MKSNRYKLTFQKSYAILWAKMLAEADKRLPVLKEDNGDFVSGQRSMIISSSIEQLVNLQKRENRDLIEEEKLTQTVNYACNCDGSNKFICTTFLSLVSCSSENPILNPAYSKEKSIYDGSLLMIGKFNFLGLVQGDEKKPWAKTSNKNEWYLKFRAGENDIKHGIIYYAPIKGLDKIKLTASPL